MPKNEVAKQGQEQGVDVFAGLSGLDKYKAKKGEDVAGLEVMDQTDIKLPKIRLLQSNSIEVTKGGFKAGQFYNSITKTVTDSVPGILLSLAKSRVMWPDKFKRGDEPTCRSFDNITSFDGTKKCINCPFQDWDKAKAEGKNKPDCNMSYGWMGVLLESKSPFRITMGGMSVGPTKDFLNVIAPNRLPAYVYHVIISSKQEENENGVFYVAQYDIVGIIKDEELQSLKDLEEAMKSLFQKSIQIDTLDADSADSGNATGESALF